MPAVVAIAGGSGGLGRALLDALEKDDRYEPIILARTVNTEQKHATGVRYVAADYADVNSLVTLLEENNVWAVLSVMHTQDGTPETNLIQAADKSKVTKRFIPNIWSAIEFKSEHRAVFPYAGLRLAAQDALKQTSLEWTAVYTGLFLDYYILNHPTHLNIVSIPVDVRNDIAGIPGSGDDPVHFTYSFDVGTYTAALLGLEKWDQNYYVAGDQKTWNEVIEIVEKAKGVKFEVQYDSLEKLESGQITELPAHHQLAEALGGEAARPMIRGMWSTFGLWFTQGLGAKRDGVFLAEKFPEIQPLTLEHAWTK
ncbi:NAD(P)-binding protein [Lophiostoma macrostomum CBS 122681]|uniref:NAD(P)-binding protein n=1 Tax=Lophiostoma macrostomum CBS 122681 TaxID=1314788 RepID=A0A6A6SZC4_9PLEO|nr:NAD(P)-binding protein [Lophiostoma macrostomum CBS 122681]